MKKFATIALAAISILSATVAKASPEEERKALLELYQKTLPSIAVKDYVLGALAMNQDSMKQYEDIMAFPPFQDDIDKGKQLWEKRFANGKHFTDCYPAGGKNVAGNYPYFDDNLGKVVTFEMSLNECLRRNGEVELKYDDMNTMGVLSAYARSLSDGMPVNIRVQTEGAMAAYEAGKKIFYERRGQLGFSCATCHVINAGKHVRNEFLSTVIGQATHWPVFRSPGNDLWTLQRRYAGCYKLIRANAPPPGSEEFNNLEYFHTYMSQGLPLQANVFRK